MREWFSTLFEYIFKVRLIFIFIRIEVKVALAFKDERKADNKPAGNLLMNIKEIIGQPINI